MGHDKNLIKACHSTTQWSTKNAENDTNGTSVVEANQNTTNINEKKKTYCQQEN
jgi:hypothetical protein